MSHFLINWKVLTTDQWVVETVKGFQIPFSSHPVQDHWPNPTMYSAEQSLLIQEEVSTLIEEGAVTQVHNPQPQGSFYSTSLLSPQERGPDEASNKFQEAK